MNRLDYEIDRTILNFSDLKSPSHYWQLLPYLQPQNSTIALAFICTLLFTVFWPIQA